MSCPFVPSFPPLGDVCSQSQARSKYLKAHEMDGGTEEQNFGFWLISPLHSFTWSDDGKLACSSSISIHHNHSRQMMEMNVIGTKATPRLFPKPAPAQLLQLICIPSPQIHVQIWDFQMYMPQHEAAQNCVVVYEFQAIAEDAEARKPQVLNNS